MIWASSPPLRAPHVCRCDLYNTNVSTLFAPLWWGTAGTGVPAAPSAALCGFPGSAAHAGSQTALWGRPQWSTARNAPCSACWQETAPEVNMTWRQRAAVYQQRNDQGNRETQLQRRISCYWYSAYWILHGYSLRLFQYFFSYQKSFIQVCLPQRRGYWIGIFLCDPCFEHLHRKWCRDPCKMMPKRKTHWGKNYCSLSFNVQ